MHPAFYQFVGFHKQNAKIPHDSIVLYSMTGGSWSEKSREDGRAHGSQGSMLLTGIVGQIEENNNLANSKKVQRHYCNNNTLLVAIQARTGGSNQGGLAEDIVI